MKNMKKMLVAIPLALGLSFSLHSTADALATKTTPVTTPTSVQKEVISPYLKSFEGIGIVKVKKGTPVKPLFPGSSCVISDDIQFVYKGKTYLLIGNIKGLEKLNGKQVKIYGYMLSDNRYYPAVVKKPIPKLPTIPVIVVKKFEPVIFY